MENMSLRQYCIRNHKPELVRQWDIPENRDFDPDQTGYASHKKIWWHCDKGHKWQAMIKIPVFRYVPLPYQLRLMIPDTVLP